ncbi:hypothetical protein [Bradyrhizobium sp. JYMT SZCCT0428]|uniref:hypothetical protein n=1 Tax=Bradyrhizobium sp. JYMT SZCCT0428 TaxID=2807673 RepID=UPI001BA7B62E|nr:hypothetical protein [Bradyrhizobium sp. JYMT SZCCT0428]MBR1156276.1 hypothetical protein [Bradyrhizobium sp. JYMT SZCCT0428]
MKFKLVLPALYLVIALLAWFDFARLPPDGLANLGLMLVVMPITALDLALRPTSNPGHSIFMPDKFGYYGNHAVFFAVSVIIIALLLWIVGAAIDRHRARANRR